MNGTDDGAVRRGGATAAGATTAAPRPLQLTVERSGTTAAHRIFCLHHAPAGPARGGVVYLPPFGEEMNKSRRMAALQARALAAAGWHVLQPDLYGTGDSDGDFADASWAAWLDDAAAARSWLRDAAGAEPWLWGLRLGAVLAAASLERRPAPASGLVLWQPVVSGRQHLQQFLRLQAGADWIAGAGAADASAKPIDRLRAGDTVEVAGYAVAPALALPLADAVLRLDPAAIGSVAWFEVSPRDDAVLSPVGVAALAAAPPGGAWRSAVVRGPSFWQSVEIETAAALLEATGAAFAVGSGTPA